MIGKRVRDALYIHRSAVLSLDATRAARLAAAAAAVPDAPWTVARVAPDHVGLLVYEPFESVAFPALLEAWRVTLAPHTLSHRSYRGAANPLILHRKELLSLADAPGRAHWEALTAALEARGLFSEPHLIGRQRAWEARLAEAGVRVEGHVLCPA